MSERRNSLSAAAVACAATILLYGSGAAKCYAQWPSLSIGMEHAVADEFGRTLEGTSPVSDLFGIPVVEGDLVHVMLADNGVFPPDIQGNPHPENPVLRVTRIGSGTSPDISEPGRFATTVSPRPNDHTLFVRLFNSPAASSASFYSDSQAHVVTTSEDALFVVDIADTDLPIDPRDPDGDGLNNAWETSYGSDDQNPDSDADGSPDGDEHVAGTLILDSNSVFVVARLFATDGYFTVEWDSVPGRKYLVEYTDASLLTAPAYEALTDEIIATDTTSQAVLSPTEVEQHGCIRVRVLAE